MKNEKYLTSLEWAQALIDFNAQVKLHHYSPINYNEWRRLNTLSEAELFYFPEEVKIQVYTYSIGEIFTYSYSSTSSFGYFLYQRFFMEEKDMNYSNSIGLTANEIYNITTTNGSYDPAAVTKIDTGIVGAYNGITIMDAKANKTEVDTLNAKIAAIETKIDNLKIKENKEMKNFTFDFGPCNDDQVRMSMYGLAVKNASGAYVSYDKETGTIVDVDILNFKGAKYMYKMPSAIAEVRPLDIVIHARKPMIVIENKTKSLTVIDPIAGEKKEILPTVSPFGFTFITKIFCPFSMSEANASAANPFGNMMFPLMFMDDDNLDENALFMMMAMGGNTSTFVNNPMFLYCLMGENKDMKSMLPFLMMSQQQPTTPNA